MIETKISFRLLCSCIPSLERNVCFNVFFFMHPPHSQVKLPQFNEKKILPNYMDCLNDHAPDQSACAKVMENELKSNQVVTQYYFLLVFVSNYHVTMGKCCKKIQFKRCSCTFTINFYFIPGNRDIPLVDRGRPSLLAPDILCWLLACWLA